MEWWQAAAVVVGGALAITLTVRWGRRGVDRRRTAMAEWRYRSRLLCTLGGLFLAGALAMSMTTGTEWPGLVCWLLAVNVVAFAFYGWDKLAAKRAAPRIPEATLLLLALAGGTVGAFLGQRAFTHKTSKVGFQLMFWGVVALQAAVLIAYAQTRSTPS
jgi:uncharacterized membrane protein YsdA (DUF1294 family)